MNKLILNQHLSGKNGVYEVGDEIELSDSQAIAFVEKGIASFKAKKDHDSLMKKAAKIKQEKAESEAKAKAILEKSKIQNELNRLYEKVVLKEAELNGEVLSNDEILSAVEELQKRDAMGTKKAEGK